MAEVNYKAWLQSKTVWGALIMVLSMVATAIFGVEVDVETQALTVDKITLAIGAVVDLVGFVLVLYGRAKAKLPLKGLVSVT